MKHGDFDGREREAAGMEGRRAELAATRAYLEWVTPGGPGLAFRG